MLASRLPFLFLILLSIAAAGTVRAEGPRFRVSLLTVSPGAELEERLGHSALAIEDHLTGSELAYNFGTFEDSDDLVLDFLHQRLRFYVAAMNPGVLAIRYQRREIRAQELLLDDAHAARLAALLGDRVRPENRRFDYDLFTENCVTPIRDLLDQALDGALRRHTEQPAATSFRRAVMQGLSSMPLLGAFTALTYGPYTDAPRSRWEMLFMPDALHDAIAELRAGDAPGAPPLVLREKRWRGEAYEDLLPLPNPWFLGGGLGLLFVAGLSCLLLVRTRATGRRLLGSVGALLALLGGVIGAGIYYLGFMPLACVQHNANRFLLNPLDLLAVPLLLSLAYGRLSQRATRGLFLLLGVTTVIAVGHALIGHAGGLCAQQHGAVVAWALCARAVLLVCAAAVVFSRDARR